MYKTGCWLSKVPISHATFFDTVMRNLVHHQNWQLRLTWFCVHRLNSELCHKNNMLESQNGLLNAKFPSNVMYLVLCLLGTFSNGNSCLYCIWIHVNMIYGETIFTFWNNCGHYWPFHSKPIHINTTMENIAFHEGYNGRMRYNLRSANKVLDTRSNFPRNDLYKDKLKERRANVCLILIPNL